MADDKKKKFSFTDLHGKYIAHGPAKLPKVTKEFSKYMESTDPNDLASAVRDVSNIGISDFTKHMNASKYNDNQLVRTALKDVKKGLAKTIISKLEVIDYKAFKGITGLDPSKLDAIKSGKEKLSDDTIDDLIRHYDEFAGTKYNELINQLQNKKLKTFYANLKAIEDQHLEQLTKHLDDKIANHIYSGVDGTRHRSYHLKLAKKKGVGVDELHFGEKTKKQQMIDHHLLNVDRMPAKKEYSDHSWYELKK